jgi:hypothetical protein
MPNVPTNVLVTGLASGLDRQDGLGGRGGTPTNLSLVTVNGPSGLTTAAMLPIEESKESPTIERAEQCTVRHVYNLPWTQAQNYLASYARGALVTDAFNNFYRVLSSEIQYQGAKGAGYAQMVVVCESISFDVPPDEFSIVPVKLGLDIFKHPRYFYALMPSNQIPGGLNIFGVADTNAEINAKQSIIRALQAYRENPFVPNGAALDALVGALQENIHLSLVTGQLIVQIPCPNFSESFPASTPVPIGSTPPATPTSTNNPKYQMVYASTVGGNSVALALAAARELIGKLWRMEDTPLLNGMEMTWSEYYYRPPPINLGCYVEDPITQASPSLPDYFYSIDNPPDTGSNVFQYLSTFNPQCYASNGIQGGPVKISWLRDADTLEYQRTWFKVTRKWLGATFGTWDMDLYGTPANASGLSASSGVRPTMPSQYRTLQLSN